MTSMTERDLNVKVKQRGVVRANVTKALKKVSVVLTHTPLEVTEVKAIAEQLRDHKEKLNALDELILPELPDSELENEIERAEQYQINLITGLSNIQESVNAAASAPVSPAPAGTSGKDTSPKLPKLEIPKYNGDPLLWDEFWDNFSSSIHERSDLPVIDKFKYLKSFLDGDALRLADGYRLTTVNYDEVVQALKERFGDPELATFSHFEALIALKPASYCLHELRTILDKCESHIRSLVALGLPETTFGVVFTPLILSKLPKGVKIELHRKNGLTPWRLGNLRALLKDEINAREKGERIFASTIDTSSCNGPSSKPKNNGQTAKPTRRPVSSSTLNSTGRSDSKSASTSPNCVFCSKNHFSSSCTTYKDIDLRLKRIQGRCHCCLRLGHRAPECRSKRPCYFCKRDTHHQSLCRTQFQTNAAETGGALITTSSESLRSSHIVKDAPTRPESNLSLQTPNSNSILQTAQAQIRGVTGNITARLYFDTGGSRSYISATAVKKIGAKYVGQEAVSVGRFRDQKQSSVTYKIYEFDILLPNGKSMNVRMSSEAVISCPIQLIPLDPNCSILSQVKLAEPLVSKPVMVTIDILVGNDYYYSFIGQEQLRCPNGVVLLSSPFGFVTGGAISTKMGRRDHDYSFLIHNRKEPEYSIERFWRLEDLGVRENPYENDDEAALKMFNETVQFHDGRYYAKWPWKPQTLNLPDNYALAYGRLKSLLKRTQVDQNLLAAYNRNIEEQRQRGVIEVAPRSPDGIVHYIPHHAVVSPSKKTTKLRIVYDASAKTSKDAASLNECLYRGPIFLADSVGILLRWRLPAIAMVSDIEKAFLQVGLQPSDRDVTRFLWLKNIYEPPTQANLEVLRFCRVPFGVISSPFLLAATIAHHLKQTGGPTARVIEGNVYVDNVFCGASSVENALKFHREAKQLFANAAMNLREWLSNSADVMAGIDECDRESGSTTSVLGLKWNTETDTFNISVGRTPSQSSTWTKRSVLQLIASVFDPLGLLAPLTVRGKMLMQQLWKSSSGWDDQLSDSTAELWRLLLKDISQIPTVRFPRRTQIPVDEDVSDLELHCFCDASSKAYSAVVYLRVTKDRLLSVDIAYSKNRISPIKAMTIPRLELMAALIGVRALKFVEEQLRVTVCRKYLWTDSSCVLQWIKKESVLTVFVQNRIKEIRSHKDVEFCFVPSLENPADKPSRGVSFSEVRNSSLWWHGPDWLSMNKANLPQAESPPAATESLPGDYSSFPSIMVVTREASTMAAASVEEASYFMDISRFSSLQRLLRVTAYVLRFIRLLRREVSKTDHQISALELELARRTWDKHVQSVHHGTLFNVDADRASKNLQLQLGLFLDATGIIRSQGRYPTKLFAEKAHFPKLIPKNTQYLRLIILECHNKLFHAGVSHTLAEIRKEYWVIHGRSQVKRVLKDCRLCRIYGSACFRTPHQATLPECRITAQIPFTTIGVDYLGPLIIRNRTNDVTKKVWICLFTCAEVRAIHLEVVESLTTEDFLLAFRRFSALYGCPQLVICDNAKQFHSAEKILSRLWRQAVQSDEVKSFSSSNKITWKFIPELSPWMGGFYERLIGLTKTALKKSLHQRCLSLTELQTLSTEIASILNSRPLLYNEATLEGEYLSPSHFLQRNYKPLQIPQSEDEFKPQLLSGDELILNWKRSQNLLNRFWKMWQANYLQSLQERFWTPSNRNSSDFPPKPGTVVIIKDRPQRVTWKLGILTELIRSHDGMCRAAVVRLPSGSTTRQPLKLMYPLEYSKDSTP